MFILIMKYPKEMQFAYRWGFSHKKKVNGFDVNIYGEKNLANNVKKELMKKLLKIINERNLKEHNE